jgi:hypothetical protein
MRENYPAWNGCRLMQMVPFILRPVRRRNGSTTHASTPTAMSLTSEFFSTPIPFAKDHSICPPSYIDGYKGKLAKTLDTSGYKGIGPNPENPVKSIKYARVMKSMKIGYMELFADVRPGGGKSEDRNDEGAGVVRMNAQYSSFGEAKPAYFLPWDESGAIIKLRIPKKGTGEAPDPDIFFTAAINGCSVFIQGDADSPTVYHAGGNTGRSDHNDAARFWRQALANHLKSSDTAQGRGKIQGEINKTHYIRTPGTKSNLSTPQADRYEQELKERLDKKGSFKIEMVSPWGCVFGVRTGNNWEFYLQENGTVVCHYVEKKNVRTVQYAKPMRLSKIFPGGTSQLGSMTHLVPVKITDA